MARTSRETWMDEGLQLLREGDVSTVRIDTLCQRLGMTKGSFYHHFKHQHEFLESLLQHWETTYTSQFIDYAEEGTTPQAKIERLNQIILMRGSAPEVSIRAWALHDKQARETVNRVDQRRMDYLVSLYVALGQDEVQARILAKAVYAIIVGANYIFPPFNAQDIHNIFDLFRHLIHSE